MCAKVCHYQITDHTSITTAPSVLPVLVKYQKGNTPRRKKTINYFLTTKLIIMANDKMTLQEKKRKLRKLRSLLNTAWNISNDLIGEEETHSKNQDLLYPVRQEIDILKSRVSLVKYGEK